MYTYENIGSNPVLTTNINYANTLQTTFQAEGDTQRH